MNCQEVNEFMQRFIDDDLNQQETSLMMDHVDQCPKCAAILARLQHLSKELAQLPEVTPRYSLVDAILPELERLRSLQTDSDATSELSSAAVPAGLTRSKRPDRAWFRKWSTAISAGIIVGLIMISQPQNWFSNSGGSDNHASEAQISMQAELFNQSGNRDEDLAKSSRKVGQSEANEELNGFSSDANAPSSVSDGLAMPSTAPTFGNGNEGKGASESVQPDPVSPDSGQAQSPAAPAEEDILPELGASSFAIPAEVSLSPDEKYRAMAVEGAGSIQIFQVENEQLLYSSEPRTGTISLLSWNEDSTLLYYTYTDIEGKQTQYHYDMVKLKESVR